MFTSTRSATRTDSSKLPSCVLSNQRISSSRPWSPTCLIASQAPKVVRIIRAEIERLQGTIEDTKLWMSLQQLDSNNFFNLYYHPHEWRSRKPNQAGGKSKIMHGAVSAAMHVTNYTTDHIGSEITDHTFAQIVRDVAACLPITPELLTSKIYSRRLLHLVDVPARSENDRNLQLRKTGVSINVARPSTKTMNTLACS